MRSHRLRRALAAGVAAAAAAVALVAIPTPLPAAAAAPVLSVTFEDGTTGALARSGGPTLEVVDDGAGGRALSVSGRTNSWDTVQSPTGLLAAGTDYTFSARIRLAAGTPGSRTAHFTVDDNHYTWVGATSATADAWTTLTGTYRLPADATPATAKFSIEVNPETDGGPQPSFLLDDVVVTPQEAPGPGPVQPPGTRLLDADFETGLQGWAARASADGPGTLAATTAQAHGGTQSAALTERTTQGDGIGHDVTGLLFPATTYEVSAWVRFGPGQPADSVWLSLARTTGATTSYDTIAQFSGISADGWTHVTARFQVGAFETGLLYFETAYQGGATGNTSDLYLDDVSVIVPDPTQVQDLTPIKDTVPFPVGVAIDSRETTGSPAELTLRHFNQISGENYMKPEAWYDAQHHFAPGAETNALMDFSQENDLRLYGHTLVWHSQTPAWFFADDGGRQLTNSPADQQVMRDRLRTHINDIARYLSDGYGLFGSDTNPLVAFDVVNEVVADGTEYADGLRRSPWYTILGEEYIDLAFQYADEAFNHTYAAPGAQRPVTLFINDYNTEQSGKQQRLHDLVARLLDRGVPVDGVGHQFHLSMSTPITSLDAALTAFQDLPITQAVTELDVTTGTPVTSARLVDQGYYYRDTFRILRAHAGDLFSVTLWGLTDGRSWRLSSGAPLAFDDDLQAKPAYYGIVDAALPNRQRAADVFRGDVALTAQATTDLAWQQLPLHQIDGLGTFQLRWEADHLSAYVHVDDATAEAADGLAFTYGTATATFRRDGTGTVQGVVTPVEGGYDVVVHLPVTATQGATMAFDVQVTDGARTGGWNAAGSTGTLSLLEPLSFLQVAPATGAPQIDGSVDPEWATAGIAHTGTQVEGVGGATADMRTLWRGDTLYVLAEVADPVVDVSGNDPWTQDSVEFFVDAANLKNGPYTPTDTQVRISADNVLSFGTGDEATQRARVTSATQRLDGGYVVEAAIDMLGKGGAGTFQGLDFQVNDASGGVRRAVHTWAEPTGTGYQTTARWGVGQFVDSSVIGDGPQIIPGASSVRAGDELPITLSGFTPGTRVEVTLTAAGIVAAAEGQPANAASPAATRVLGSVTVGDAAVTTARFLVPADTAVGRYTVVASAPGDISASAPIEVTAAGSGSGGSTADGNAQHGGLPITGASVAGIVVLAFALLAGGWYLLRRRAGAGQPAA